MQCYVQQCLDDLEAFLVGVGHWICGSGCRADNIIYGAEPQGDLDVMTWLQSPRPHQIIVESDDDYVNVE